MTEYLRIDTSFSCRIRTGRTLIASQADVSGPQPVPARPMPGRRWLRIFNHGLVDVTPIQDAFVVVGDQSIRWNSTTPFDWSGYGLQLLEFVDLAVDETVPVYAMADVLLQTGARVDLRTIELS